MYRLRANNYFFSFRSGPADTKMTSHVIWFREEIVKISLSRQLNIYWAFHWICSFVKSTGKNVKSTGKKLNKDMAKKKKKWQKSFCCRWTSVTV